ncbi:MAG: hypothetical protein ACYTGQ_05070 [Planctomycetota bacterium]|jgi:hypothetical protein
MHTRNRQHGYALLVTLALVALSGTILASVANQSLSRVSVANRAHRELQQRWGATSIRNALSPSTGERLAEAYADYLETWANHQADIQPDTRQTVPPQPPRTLRLDQKLGGVDFTILLRDESARLNVNTLYHDLNQSRDQTRKAIAAMIGRAPGDLGLDPQHDPNTETDQRSFNAFTQLFPAASPDTLIGADANDSGLAADLTLFGDGRINTRLASSKALTAALQPVLTGDEIARVHRLLREQPAAPLDAIADRLSASAARKLQQRDILTQTSHTHSLWIVADDGRRRHHRWIVIQPDHFPEPTLEFIW